MAGVKMRNPGNPAFHQAVQDVAVNIISNTVDMPLHREMQILKRMAKM
jgi:hypothetical protein